MAAGGTCLEAAIDLADLQLWWPVGGVQRAMMRRLLNP